MFKTSLTFSLSLILASFTAIASQHTTLSGGEDKNVTIPTEPADAVATILKEISKGHGNILWQAMPASYQNDFVKLFQLAGRKIDGKLHAKVISLLSRISALVKDKQVFFDNMQMDKEVTWTSLSGTIDILKSSQLWTIESLRSFDNKKFFEHTISKMIKYHYSNIPEILPFFNNTQPAISLVESDDNHARLKIKLSNNLKEHDVNFTKIEGKWLPQKIASSWPSFIDETKALISTLNLPQTQTMAYTVLFFWGQALGDLEKAQTQEEFEYAFQQLVS